MQTNQKKVEVVPALCGQRRGVPSPAQGPGGGHGTAGHLALLDDTLVYIVSFDDQLLSQDGQTLLDLAGSYRYTVDLTHKTVSLVVVQ